MGEEESSAGIELKELKSPSELEKAITNTKLNAAVVLYYASWASQSQAAIERLTDALASEHGPLGAYAVDLDSEGMDDPRVMQLVKMRSHIYQIPSVIAYQTISGEPIFPHLDGPQSQEAYRMLISQVLDRAA